MCAAFQLTDVRWGKKSIAPLRPLAPRFLTTHECIYESCIRREGNPFGNMSPFKSYLVCETVRRGCNSDCTSPLCISHRQRSEKWERVSSQGYENNAKDRAMFPLLSQKKAKAKAKTKTKAKAKTKTKTKGWYHKRESKSRRHGHDWEKIRICKCMNMPIIRHQRATKKKKKKKGT
ncbi:hypothetical protein POVWA1_027750 [Plasmodium ovale wallikeri]|uniref:Uncharacterized protein n=1 Tax=Plasmodium ovale wallikeri TaxID=864142 RepID=A0A1A8YV21_PLAOA|nr:hypothetical protein POVWA1_027750 [Plasmodium ovale wallikeri]